VGPCACDGWRVRRVLPIWWGSGIIKFLSYRDPNLLPTLDVYDSVADELLQQNISDEAIEQAVIGAVGDLDGAWSVDQKGYIALRRHIGQRTAAMRQQWREELMATTVDDFRKFGNRVAKLNDQHDTGVVVVTSSSMLEQANAALPTERQLVANQVL